MKQNIKNKEPQERQAYVPANVKVIEFTAQRVLCVSGDIEGLNVWQEGDDSANWQ